MFTAVFSAFCNSIHANLQLHPVMWCCGMSAIELPAVHVWWPGYTPGSGLQPMLISENCNNYTFAHWQIDKDGHWYTSYQTCSCSVEWMYWVCRSFIACSSKWTLEAQVMCTSSTSPWPTSIYIHILCVCDRRMHAVPWATLLYTPTGTLN